MTRPKKKHALYNPVSMMKDLDSEVIKKLSLQGVKYTHQMLECGRTQQLRKDFAQQTGLPLAFITDLVSRADLMRLSGVGGDLSLLLLKAGVVSCRDLQQQDAEGLYKRLAILHIGQKIAYHAPTFPQVQSWLHEAALLAVTSPQE